MRLAVAHLPVATGNLGGLLECTSMVAHWASGNKIRQYYGCKIIYDFCSIKHYSNSPITIGTVYIRVKVASSYKTHPDLAPKKLLPKPVYKTHSNGKLRKTFLKVKTRGKTTRFHYQIQLS